MDVMLGVGRDDELAAQGLALFGCGAHEQIWALEDMVTSDSESQSAQFRAPSDIIYSFQTTSLLCTIYSEAYMNT